MPGQKLRSCLIHVTDIVDDEMMELVEIEVHEILEEFGYSKDTPVIHGSAKLALDGDSESNYGEASIHRLVEAMDTYFQIPDRDLDSPFLMPIDNAVSVPGRGTIVIGRCSELADILYSISINISQFFKKKML